MTTDENAVEPAEVDAEQLAQSFDLDDRNAPASEIDAALSAFRQQCPVVHTPRQGGYLVSDDAHAQVVGKNPGVFSARTDGGASRDLDTNYSLVSPLFDEDPDTGHTETRRALQPFFSKRAARRWEPYARRIARERMEELRPLGRCDVVVDIAYQLPWLLTGAFLGVTEEERPKYRRLAVGHFLRGETDSFDEFLSGIIIEKRRNPGPDLLSTILGIDDEISDSELLRFAKIMSGAGSLTSADSISSILLELEYDRHLRQQVQQDRTVWPRLVDEIARTQAAVFASARQVRRATTLGGVELPENALVKLCWYSAGRDEKVHKRPDTVRLDRRPGAHLGWGSGAHRCLGREMALVTLPAILETILCEIPDYRLAGDAPAPQRTFGALRGVDKFLIEWAA